MRILKKFYTKCWNPQFTLNLEETYVAITYEIDDYFGFEDVRVSFIPIDEYQNGIYTKYDISKQYTSVSENLLQHICYTEQEMRDIKLKEINE